MRLMDAHPAVKLIAVVASETVACLETVVCSVISGMVILGVGISRMGIMPCRLVLNVAFEDSWVLIAVVAEATCLVVELTLELMVAHLTPNRLLVLMDPWLRL